MLRNRRNGSIIAEIDGGDLDVDIGNLACANEIVQRA